jgi:hypothetical protein
MVEVKPSSPVALGKWIATLAAILTPVCYLNGRAFHSGYLTRLHLEPSMFPLDTQGTFIEAAGAWMQGSSIVLRAFSEALAAHWFLALLLPIALVLGLSFILHVVVERALDLRTRIHQHPTHHARWKRVASMCVPVGLMLFAVYAIYTALTLIRAVLLLAMGPFVLAGQQAAASDLAKGFPNEPATELTPPQGERAAYRIILCSEKFCALYRDGEVVTVPFATITWASSRPSGLKAP